MDWQENYIRLFMSHVSVEKEFVGQVRDALDEYGIDGFVAHQDIGTSSEWQDEIQSALQTCQAFAAFLHTGFRESDWADQEIGYVVATDAKVIPLRFDLNPYGFIGKLQAASCNNLTPNQVAATIFEAVHATDGLPSDEALVKAFETSPNFDQADKRSRRLDRVTEWTPSLLDRIGGALDDNSQCSGAFQAGHRVAKIVESHRRDAASASDSNPEGYAE